MPLEPQVETKGREIYEDPKPDEFLEDFNRILNSTLFSLLADKGQVFIHPKDGTITTRLTHTLKCYNIGSEIAKRTNQNRNLVMAILFGHDIGHFPYGHFGERTISKITGKDIRHEFVGPLLLHYVEELNLTPEVYEGIRRHSIGWVSPEISRNQPGEYTIGCLSDKVAHQTHDVDDILKTKYWNSLPDVAYELGRTTYERERVVIDEIVNQSLEKGFIHFADSKVFELCRDLRRELKSNVYSKLDETVHRKELEKRIEAVYDFIDSEKQIFLGIQPEIALAYLNDTQTSFIATHRSQIKKNPRIIRNYSLMTIIPKLFGKQIDLRAPEKDLESQNLNSY
ncbi:HD domain-containing protein [Candidatus Woesearchaeota archaeon]|nr:HD domain-containing protein [Candidatus Woesearchaeota archaeon]